MAEVQDSTYLSIGEVLGLLLEEFPDITISKIRFLESQGLISPERTPSGYRKFYDDDVELLRVILTEQRQNYLPLRVIKDRLKTGEIDPTGEHLRPDGVDEHDDQHEPLGDQDQDRDVGHHDAASHDGDDQHDDGDRDEVPASAIASHPASRGSAPTATGGASPPGGAQLLPGVLLDRDELCAMIGMTEDELDQLESFGIVTARDGASAPLYGADAVEIARPACEFLRLGVDARHLRGFRTSAEREASLYEQLVTPRFRQRNPESRAEALAQLRRLDALGATLRAALTRHALRHHFDV